MRSYNVNRAQAAGAMRAFVGQMDRAYAVSSDREVAEINRRAREQRAENIRRTAAAK